VTCLQNLKVSHETIYQCIADDGKAGGDLSLNLRTNAKRRYHRRSKIRRVRKIQNRVDIAERPTVVTERKRYEGWEADLTQGGLERDSCSRSVSVEAVSGTFTTTR
jgi:IS30 family transposase